MPRNPEEKGKIIPFRPRKEQPVRSVDELLDTMATVSPSYAKLLKDPVIRARVKGWFEDPKPKPQD